MAEDETPQAGVGRPSTFDPKTADIIAKRMADGESLRAICRDDGMPAESTVRGWHVNNTEGFGGLYERASAARVDFWAEELIEIADDGTNDWMTRKAKGGEDIEVVDAEHIQRSRLRVDTRKWLMSKMAPKKYGDKLAIGGDENAPPIQHKMTIEFVKPTEAANG